MECPQCNKIGKRIKIVTIIGGEGSAEIKHCPNCGWPNNYSVK